MKPTAQLASTSTKNGNCFPQLTKEKSKLLKSTWLNQLMRLWKTKSNCRNTLQLDFTRVGQRKFQNLLSTKELTRDFQFKNGSTLSLKKRPRLLTFHLWTKKTTRHYANQLRTHASLCFCKMLPKILCQNCKSFQLSTWRSQSRSCCHKKVSKMRSPNKLKLVHTQIQWWFTASWRKSGEWVDWTCRQSMTR